MAAMQALVLAAGWATRLGPLAHNTPKHLLPIGERCSLDFVTERQEAVPWLEQVHVITHDIHFPRFVEWGATHNGRAIISVHSDGTSSVDERLGAIGDIAFFLKTCPVDDDLLIVAGDNVFDFDLTPLAERARRELVVGLYEVESRELASRYGVVELDSQGYVTSFVEKPADPQSSLAAMAIYGFPRERLGDVHGYLEAGGNPDKLGSLMEWLHTRRRVAGHVFAGRWFDVGSPDEYARVLTEFGS